MEYSCKSIKYPEERRPTSGKFVELHVLFVPNEQWNLKLNRVPAEAMESFISAGFIRVYPDISLRTLRSEIGILLGAERNLDKFSFLKCVGRSLALVKAKQEKDLKVKFFSPPYAPQPELYLLPMVEGDNSVCSQSLTPDTHSHSTDPQTYYTARVQGMPTGTQEVFKFPQIPQDLQPQHPPFPSPDESEGEESYSSTEENEEDLLSSQKPGCAEDYRLPRKARAQGPPRRVIDTKESVVVKVAPARSETTVKKKQHFKRTQARDSGVPESLEDQDSVFSPTRDRFRKPKDAQTLKDIRNKQSEVPEHPVTMPTQYASPPPAPTLGTRKTAAPVFLTRDELIEEIKMAKEERKQLEQTRQELLRKGKYLLAQNRYCRNQARDSWKKSYFDTKKATAPLEVTLRSLRQELEIINNNILHQLKARDGGGKPRQQGRLSSTKNALIIQIMTESHEIDNQKRKVDDAKMKLVTEIKLRKQAATELGALKAELAQKKTQTSLYGSMGFGAGARDRPQAP